MVPALLWFVGTLEALRFASTCCEDVTGEVPLWCSRKTEIINRNRRLCFESEGSHRVHEYATTSQGSRQRCVDFGDLVLFGATRRCKEELKRSWCVVRCLEVETHTNTERKSVVLGLRFNGFSPVVVS
uniref:Putative secreted protein n=1 Tax=Ixodes ricinus TaxID=34613 RepID=A0A6B0UQL0_IXORI